MTVCQVANVESSHIQDVLVFHVQRERQFQQSQGGSSSALQDTAPQVTRLVISAVLYIVNTPCDMQYCLAVKA